MDEVIAFVLAFGKHWTTVMSGAVGLVLTGLGFSGSVPAGWAFVVAGMLCFFGACFLVWRDEYRKTIEDPVLAAERQKTFSGHIESLRNPEIWCLRRIALDGFMAGQANLAHLSGRTSLIVREGNAWKPNPTYRKLLEDWAKVTPDPPESE